MLGTTPRTARFGDTLVRFIDVGPLLEAQGMPVLFVHGFGGSIGDFGPILVREANHRRVMALDLPGFGASEATGRVESMNTFVQVVRRFIKASGAEEVHLVGHSLGGQICLALCLEEPASVRSLVLIDTAGVYEASAFMRGVSAHYARINIGDVSSEQDRSLFDLFRGDGRGLVFNRLVSDDPRTRASLASFALNLRRRAHELSLPTTVVWGDADPLFDVENAVFLKENIVGARLYVIEGAGHVPQLTHEALVAQYLSEHFHSTEVKP